VGREGETHVVDGGDVPVGHPTGMESLLYATKFEL
jgi:hypothetical protein